jgi:hypothetical protein
MSCAGHLHRIKTAMLRDEGFVLILVYMINIMTKLVIITLQLVVREKDKRPAISPQRAASFCWKGTK